MSRSDRALRLRDVAAQAVGPLGLSVDDVTVTPIGSRLVVRVTVERDLSSLDPADLTSTIPPISLDDVADASRAIDRALEVGSNGVPGPGSAGADAILGAAAYVLEVSSPGVDRVLRQQHHFRRNVGRLVTVQTTDGARVRGRLSAAGADLITLSVPAPGAAEPAVARAIPLAQVGHGRVEVEFAPAGTDELAELEELEET